ncbi:MAG: tryptophan-rich sensory protein [Lachnospiraceae bacterium]|nr:tryptophan-rich sensory protein [Lachnospiraceae bacterium]
MYRALKYTNLVFFILMIAINSLANSLPIGYGKTGEISKKYPNLFTPAPITFAIWGVIYLMLAIFILYQFDFFNRNDYANVFVELVGPWFIISCILNIGWIFSWHYDKIGLSMLFMVGLLFSLIVINLRISPSSIMQATNTKSIALLARLCMHAFDIYLGWIVAATIANLSVLLVEMRWDRFGLPEEILTIIVLIIGAILGMLFILTSQKYFGALAIIWAYCGILIKHISQSGYGGKYPAIITTTAVGIFLIFAAAPIRILMNMNMDR